MKNFTRKIVVGLVLATVSVLPAFAQNSAKVKPDRKATERIVREYLLRNPEILREAMQALQVKEEKERNLQTAANIKKLGAEIYSDSDSPVLGNPDADVTVVVFYDYFCGYCRKTLPGLQELAAKDSSVKIIFKEFPIMGEQSMAAAKAVLAAAKQGKFKAFHEAMVQTESANDETFKSLSEKLGLDYEKLQKDMNSPQIDAAVSRNIKLAEALNVNGTPAYLVGSQFVPGAIDIDSLARMVSGERTKLAANRSVKGSKSGSN